MSLGTLAAAMRVWVRRLLGAVILIGLTVVCAVVLVEILSWPDVAALESANPTTTAFMERARRQGLGIDWRWTPLRRISPEVQKAVIVAEDISFFSHSGFDRDEMAVALREAIRGQRIRGASTISQQLVKNLWLSPSRSPLRKLDEALLTRQLERRLSKHRILELYLNVVELGPGLFGVEAAARRYFGRSAARLDADQAARLAAALPRPKSWHPGSDSRSYARYVAEVRRRMEQADWLDRHLESAATDGTTEPD